MVLRRWVIVIVVQSYISLQIVCRMITLMLELLIVVWIGFDGIEYFVTTSTLMVNTLSIGYYSGIDKC